MAKAKKLPSGTWRVLVYAGIENGKRKYVSITAPEKKEAELLAAQFAADRERRQHISELTVGEMIDEYVNNRSKVLSPATIREYKRSRKHDMQNLMNMKGKLVTSEIVQSEINREAMSHAPKTVRNMYGIITAVFSVYFPNIRLSVKLPQKVKTSIYVPSDEDITRLIHSLEDSELKKAVLLAAFGSLRRSEICALSDANIKGQFIEVMGAIVYDENNDWVGKPPKTFAGYRLIEFPEVVMRSFDGISGPLVKLNPNQITRKFSRALERCGIKHFRFHDLRHYQASILHALGVPDKYIMERGGWRSKSTLDKVYKHTMEAKTKEVAKVANDHFTKLMQHEMQHDDEKTQ